MKCSHGNINSFPVSSFQVGDKADKKGTQRDVNERTTPRIYTPTLN